MRIGIIGFGFMGSVHLSAIEHVEHATLTAVSSRMRPGLDQTSRGNLPHIERTSLPEDVHWYSDWRELLLDPDIDAVDICLPTYLHKRVVLEALERGKHVLCEKPMALTASDCEELLEAASKSNRVFMVGQVLRFMFPYNYAAFFIHTICHGSVKSCVFTRKTGYPQWNEWLSTRELSGGAILDLLCHDIDQALELFGWPVALRAVSDGEVDTMHGTLFYENGPEVKIEGGWYAPELPFSAGFQITAENASLSFQEGKLLQTVDGKDELIDFLENLEYIEEMAYFVECCRQNVTPQRCLPLKSAKAVKLATLFRLSRDQQGKEITCAQ